MNTASDRSTLCQNPLQRWGVSEHVQKLHLNFPWKPSLAPPFKVLPFGPDRLLLTDELNHRVMSFDSCGELVWQTGGKGSSPGKFWYPRGSTILDSEIFVCDSWNHRIQVLDLYGRFVCSFGSYGSRPQHLNEPSDIEVDSQGKLWVVDTGNHCLKIFTPKGDLENVIGRRLSIHEERALCADPRNLSIMAANPGFSYPRRFLASYDGWFCVDDQGNKRISLISADGRLAATMDTGRREVTRYMDSESRTAGEIERLPVACLHLEELEVLGWDGTVWRKLPAPRFSEVHGTLVRGDERDQFLLHYYDWTSQELIRYWIILPSQLVA